MALRIPSQRFVFPALCACELLTSRPALAAEPEITSDTAAQFYELRSPSGETVILRRRLTSTLGANVDDLASSGADPKAPSLSFRIRLRYDADYGGTSGETDVTNYGRLVPGLQRGPIDLMYGYVEGRRFLSGWLGFRLGRQYVTDALGWWSFDGGLVKVTTPFWVTVEGYGGLEQRGGLPWSLPRYERDGVWRGNRSSYDAALWTPFQEGAVAPAYGGAIESVGLSWLHGRASYRRVYNTGAATIAPSAGSDAIPTYDATRISQERFGYAMDATWANVGAAKAGVAYDLYARRVSNLYASLDAYASRRVTVSTDYDYYVPTFDADSIWNYFLAMPMNDLAVRASWDPTDKLAVSTSTRARVFQVQTSPSSADATTITADPSVSPSSKFRPVAGGDFSARYRFGQGRLGARGACDFSTTGERLGMDVFGERTLETRYVLQARGGVWRWSDALRPDRDATSLQYVLGAGYKLSPKSLALAEFEHDINRLAGQRFRVMLWLSLAVTK